MINRLFNESLLSPATLTGVFNGASPSGTNLWETNDAYIAEFVMPGVRSDSIQCEFREGVLTVRGESAIQIPDDAKAVWQTFDDNEQYQLQLPTEVDVDHARAAYWQGILTVTLPKAAHARPRTIKIAAK